MPIPDRTPPRRIARWILPGLALASALLPSAVAVEPDLSRHTFEYVQPDTREDNAAPPGLSWLDIHSLSITTLPTEAVWAQFRLGNFSKATGFFGYRLWFTVHGQEFVAHAGIAWRAGEALATTLDGCGCAYNAARSAVADSVHNFILIEIDPAALRPWGPGVAVTGIGAATHAYGVDPVVGGASGTTEADRLEPSINPLDYVLPAGPRDGSVAAGSPQEAPFAPAPHAWLWVGGMIVLVIAVRRPLARFAGILLGWLQFTRVSREKLLHNPIRERLHQAVATEPGIGEADLGRRLEIPRGTARFHLRALERGWLVRCVRDGKFRRYYAVGPPTRAPASLGPLANPRVRALVGHMNLSSTISEQDLCRATGLSRGTIWWRMKALVSAGLVSKVRERGRARYAPTPKLIGLLKARGR